MKTATAPLIALLNSGADFQQADVWTITLSGGQVLRYSSIDIDLVVNGNTFSKGPLFKRSSITEKRGLEVSDLAVTIEGDDNDLINGVPIIKFISNRGLDGANVKVDRAFFTDWGQTATGSIVRFAGRVTGVRNVSGLTAEVSVASWSILLNVMMPANLYQAACLHTVYDTGCTLNPASFTASGSCTGTPGVLSFGSSVSATTGDYDQGRLVFTSGANNGLARAIRANVGGTFTLVSPLPVAPAAGDTFTVYKGCDLTMGTCLSKFNNLNNFKGTPFVPIPEAAL